MFKRKALLTLAKELRVAVETLNPTPTAERPAGREFSAMAVVPNADVEDGSTDIWTTVRQKLAEDIAKTGVLFDWDTLRLEAFNAADFPVGSRPKITDDDGNVTWELPDDHVVIRATIRQA